MVCVELRQARDQRMNQLFDVTFNFFFKLRGEQTESQVWLVLWSCPWAGEGPVAFSDVCVCEWWRLGRAQLRGRGRWWEVRLWIRRSCACTQSSPRLGEAPTSSASLGLSLLHAASSVGWVGIGAAVPYDRSKLGGWGALHLGPFKRAFTDFCAFRHHF